MFKKILVTSAVVLIMVSCKMNKSSDWKVKTDKIVTKWANQVNPENVLPEYPRPQMVREKWINLNGLWDYAIVPKEQSDVKNFSGKILVPFPVESALSGVSKTVTPQQKIWYKKAFEIPENWQDKKILLHFDAVDWETNVWVNRKYLGLHKGGYDSFSFDITDALNKRGSQEIKIAVWDPTDTSHQPRGKQSTDPKGFWYTAVSGIWKTVWLEPVEKAGHIESIKLTPDIDENKIRITTSIFNSKENYRIRSVVKDGDKIVGEFFAKANQQYHHVILDAKLWSPQNPFLYDIEFFLMDGEEVIDRIKSYFAMRKIGRKNDKNGIPRLALNNKIYFQFGLLDQGWWPDGLYRAPTDAALKYDIETAKKLGFNMLRKHGKVEPDRWYYWCDKLGMLVWQDMTPGDITGEYGTDRTQESAKQFEVEYAQMLKQLYNHPSVITWVIFNEGWGQYDTERLVKWTKTLDTSRLVIGASGFVDEGYGDILDVHAYPGPTGAATEKERATTLGEFGGLGFPVKKHLWNEDKSWGYVNFKNTDELTNAFVLLIQKLHPYVSEGISGAIYTQLTDVENEVNGMMTYDRAVIKMDVDRINDIINRLYSVKPASFKFREILPTSQKIAQNWKYTLDTPSEEWMISNFNDSKWRTGQGGFGDNKDYNPIIRTIWTSPELWLRTRFIFSGDQQDQIVLKLYHQFELISHIYLNGELIAEGPEYSNAYTFIELDSKAKQHLKNGENVLAVYCKHNKRRAYFDCGIYAMD
jgi:hypothetical protein